MLAKSKTIRTLVVDDSAVMRRLISKLLGADPEIEVVATAIDGDFALHKIEQMKPDVVTLDIDMPRMDGLTALSHIMKKYSLPVVMLSSLTTSGAALTMKALEMGAVDFVCKPRGSGQVERMAAELIAKIKIAARSRRVTIEGSMPPVSAEKKKIAREPGGRGADKVVAIGASSGGPLALRYLLPRIPVDFDAGIVVVQHMPENFTSMLARWLDEICGIEVREAREGDLALPGRALIAPGSAHLKVRRGAMGAEAVLEKGEPVNGHIPSVDVLFQSVADEFGGRGVGVILTGMGSDGASGLGDVKKAGGLTVAQDKDSCAVFGMPRVAIDKGHARAVVSLEDMPSYLVAKVGRSGEMEVRGHVERG